MWRAIFLVGILFTFSRPAGAAQSTWTPKPDQLGRLEKQLILPHGARPLNDYARYYWGMTQNGVKIIQGVFVFGEKTGLTILKNPPVQQRTDQGCNRVFVTYDPSNDRMTVSCDGIG